MTFTHWPERDLSQALAIIDNLRDEVTQDDGRELLIGATQHLAESLRQELTAWTDVSSALRYFGLEVRNIALDKKIAEAEVTR